MQVEDIQDSILAGCLTKPFLCHETMLNRNTNTDNKWLGNFDPERRPDGTPCSKLDHQLCAGFAYQFAEDLNIDRATLNIDERDLPNDLWARPPYRTVDDFLAAHRLTDDAIDRDAQP